RAYKDVIAKAGKIPGLRGRWLAHAVDDQAAGYTLSLWENEAAMRTYENSAILQKTILPRLKPFFSGDYTTTRCEPPAREHTPALSGIPRGSSVRHHERRLCLTCGVTNRPEFKPSHQAFRSDQARTDQLHRSRSAREHACTPK